ncbi:MAG: TM2 domain-containing protein [Terrisporobacter sp.]
MKSEKDYNEKSIYEEDEELCIEKNCESMLEFNSLYEDNIFSEKSKNNKPNKKYSVKSWWATLIFCIILGVIGFHRFYVGKAGTAILMLFTLGGFGIWVLVDLITIIINNFTDEDGKIVKRKQSSDQH